VPTPTPPPVPNRGETRRNEPPRGNTNREIESWLGELRGGAPAAQPSADATRAMPVGNEPTTAIPAQSPKDQDATEKIDTREAADDDQPKRRGGGMSAADLLRREGRY
jgi:RND superfamily putative drug exporter